VSIQGISNRQLSPAGRVALLGAITAAVWLLLALPAYLIAGMKGLDGLTLACVACSVSGVPVVWLLAQIPVSPIRVWFVIFGMGIRMVAVAIVVLFVWKFRPDFGWANFYSWLVVVYNLMLVAETYLVLPGAGNSNARP